MANYFISNQGDGYAEILVPVLRCTQLKYFYVMHLVATVVLYVSICVGGLPHILVSNYQLFICSNPILL